MIINTNPNFANQNFFGYNYYEFFATWTCKEWTREGIEKTKNKKK